MTIQCGKCGKFCSNITATIKGIDDTITQVNGECKTCGKVDLTNTEWVYEDFFPEKVQQ